VSDARLLRAPRHSNVLGACGTIVTPLWAVAPEGSRAHRCSPSQKRAPRAALKTRGIHAPHVSLECVRDVVTPLWGPVATEVLVLDDAASPKLRAPRSTQNLESCAAHVLECVGR
jgi:hypothetical protein